MKCKLYLEILKEILKNLENDNTTGKIYLNLEDLIINGDIK